MTYSDCNTCKLQYICSSETRKKLLKKGGECSEYIPEDNLYGRGC